ncbi:ATP-binding protein [Sulfurisphaera javensis]|uniref:ATP-binding protein n=1 Tax=Sulfurisphaera javensis TaxID=2049879 RepID=A0AAT9GT72_9CREN
MNEDAETIIQDLSKKLEEAENFAYENSSDGKIIGRVTRFETIKLGERNYIGIDIAFSDYYSSNIKNGEYLAIRTIVQPVVVVGQVVSITRSDMLAEFNIREVSYPRDPTTIMTQTFLELKPIAEIEGNEKRPAVSPIDPQSPVFRPKAKLLQEVLGIPEEGIVIGKIYSGGRTIDADVRLDEDTLVHHTLIIGTTGSGKTTLLKNILSQAPSALYFDRQGDFVRYLISKGDEFSVVMPSVRMMVEDIEDVQGGKQATLILASEFSHRYGCQEPISDDIKDGEVILDCNGTIVHLVPYSIKFSKVIDSLHKILPNMSAQARTFWPVIVVNLRKEIKNLINISNKYPQLKSTLTYSKIFDQITPSSLLGETIKLEVNEDIDMAKLTGLPTYITPIKNEHILSINIHSIFENNILSNKLNLAPQTKEAIIRNLRSLSEFGIFNVKGTFDVNFEKLGKKTIVDLSWVLEATASIDAIAIIAYSLLTDFYNYKDSIYKKGGNLELTILALDEAHEYFPQTKDEEAKSTIEGLINRLMRLGRVRKVAVVLATHMPEDLNPLILQLSNTKIVMRNEENVLEKLGFEDYADILLTAQAGLGVIRSIKFSDVVMRTLLP